MPIEVFSGVWNMTPGMSNSYLVVGEEHSLLIDTGIGREDMLEQIAKITDTDVTLINTHFHGDHTGSNDVFEAFYIGEADMPFLDEKLRAKARSLDGLKEFNLGGGVKAEFIPLTGHTPGSYGVLIRAKRLFFTGDMICNGTIFMIDGQCNFEDFIVSMKKIEEYAETADWLVTCHGEPSRLPVSHAGKQIKVAEAYLRGELQAEERDGGFEAGKYYVDENGLGFFRPIR